MFPTARQQGPSVWWTWGWAILSGVSLATSYAKPVTGVGDNHMAQCLLVKLMSRDPVDPKGLCLAQLPATEVLRHLLCESSCPESGGRRLSRCPVLSAYGLFKGPGCCSPSASAL